MAIAELEAQVKTTRAQYDASVQALLSRLAKLPNTAERLGKLDSRLDGLEKEVAGLRKDLQGLASMSVVPKRSSLKGSAPKALGRSVSWSEKDDVATIPDKNGNMEDEEDQEPPPNVGNENRRGSCLSSSSFLEVAGGGLPGLPGSRMVTLQTGSEILGPLECILAEPLGKQVSPESYIATGLVICLHGNAPSVDVLEEWGAAFKSIKWLELGTSIALPNLEMTPTLTIEDLEQLVDATLKLTSLESCILVGKAWGGLRAIACATSERLAKKIEGVVLIAPSSPVPEAVSDVQHPVLLVWGHDDDTEEFKNCEEWMEALEDRDEGVTTLVECEHGGHHFGELMDSMNNDNAATDVRNFTVASLLHSDLAAAAESKTGLSERARRLTSELPSFLMAQSGGDCIVDSDAVRSGEVTKEGQEQSSRSSRRLSALLPQWVASGMPTSSE